MYEQTGQTRSTGQVDAGTRPEDGIRYCERKRSWVECEIASTGTRTEGNEFVARRTGGERVTVPIGVERACARVARPMYKTLSCAQRHGLPYSTTAQNPRATRARANRATPHSSASNLTRLAPSPLRPQAAGLLRPTPPAPPTVPPVLPQLPLSCHFHMVIDRVVRAGQTSISRGL